MIFAPVRLGETSLNAEAVAADKKSCKRFGPCGVGEKALYQGRSNINGTYSAKKFAVAVPVLSNESQLVGIVLAVMDESEIMQVWRSFIGMFLMTSAIILLISFLASSVTSMRQIKPIREMAQATRQYAEGDFDQMDRVLYDLKNTPYSRRIMTNTYVFSDLSEMHLYPCAYSVTYNVTQRPQDDKPTLNMILNQRSQDILAANNWNVCQYAILLMMVAQSVDMIPGELLHVIADAHIYDRHIDLVKEVIAKEPFEAPKVRLNPDVDDFYKFTRLSFEARDYKYSEFSEKIPVAV